MRVLLALKEKFAGRIALHLGLELDQQGRKGDYPYWNEQAYADCKQFCPDVVILKLGTNDSKDYNWIYKKEFQKDMQDISF